MDQNVTLAVSILNTGLVFNVLTNLLSNFSKTPRPCMQYPLNSSASTPRSYRLLCAPLGCLLHLRPCANLARPRASPWRVAAGPQGRSAARIPGRAGRNSRRPRLGAPTPADDLPRPAESMRAREFGSPESGRGARAWLRLTAARRRSGQSTRGLGRP